MSDPAHEATEKIIKQIEARINKEYKIAITEIKLIIDDYYKRHREKDKTWRAWVDDVKDSDPKEYKIRLSQYQEWLKQQLIVGKRWQDLKQEVAEELLQARKIAEDITYNRLPEIYAINHNYGTYEVEIGSMVDTSYILYDKNTVARILRDNPQLLPNPGKKVAQDIIEGKAIRWSKQKIQSVMLQSILQGESIPKIADRLAETVGDSDRKAAVRNARTMATGAQNAGRIDSYKRAVEMGIDMKQQWLATHDMRTRHEHRLLDYQVVEVGQPFVVPGTEDEIMYPGDPNAKPHLIYNCRCTVRGLVEGLEPMARKYRDLSDIGGDYESWKNSKEKPKTNGILLPEEKAENIRKAYIAEYRHKAASIGKRNKGKKK